MKKMKTNQGDTIVINKSVMEFSKVEVFWAKGVAILGMILFLSLILFSNKSFSQVTNLKNTNTMNLLNDKIKDLKFYELPYNYDALEPHFDKMTMEIHYTKHHKAYYDNLMVAMKDNPESKTLSLLDLMKNISKYPVGVRNNGGGYFNHHLFWNILSPKPQSLPQGDLKLEIEKEFGSFENFKNEFEAAAKTRFGSGWAWLSVDNNGKLFVSSTPNQDNPYMDIVEKQGIPILGIDVWEHAYYLKFQNRRPEYVATFWNVIDWGKVEELYKKAKR